MTNAAGMTNHQFTPVSPPFIENNALIVTALRQRAPISKATVGNIDTDFCVIAMLARVMR